MIVCLCRAKSDSDVYRAIDAGASSIRDLQKCGIGTDCGSCHGMLRQMLANAHVAQIASVAGHGRCPQCDEAAVSA
jgi:bacterioferritin-associated ferredoxin